MKPADFIHAHQRPTILIVALFRGKLFLAHLPQLSLPDRFFPQEREDLVAAERVLNTEYLDYIAIREEAVPLVSVFGLYL